MLEDKLQEYIAAKGFYHFEGARGVRNLETVLNEVCGYGSYNTLDMFLEDNPGCMEAMLQWIGEQRVPEWEANLDEQLELFNAEEEEV